MLKNTRKYYIFLYTSKVDPSNVYLRYYQKRRANSEEERLVGMAYLHSEYFNYRSGGAFSMDDQMMYTRRDMLIEARKQRENGNLLAAGMIEQLARLSFSFIRQLLNKMGEHFVWNSAYKFPHMIQEKNDDTTRKANKDEQTDKRGEEKKERTTKATTDTINIKK